MQLLKQAQVFTRLTGINSLLLCFSKCIIVINTWDVLPTTNDFFSFNGFLSVILASQRHKLSLRHIKNIYFNLYTCKFGHSIIGHSIVLSAPPSPPYEGWSLTA